MTAAARWWWRCWRARHYVRLAEVAWQDRPTLENFRAHGRAVDYLRRVEATRP